MKTVSVSPALKVFGCFGLVKSGVDSSSIEVTFVSVCPAARGFGDSCWHRATGIVLKKGSVYGSRAREIVDRGASWREISALK